MGSLSHRRLRAKPSMPVIRANLPQGDRFRNQGAD